MKKAVFFDIDGTLIDWVNGLKTITPEVEKSIRKLQEDGHYAFIATGRPYAFLDNHLLNFGFDGFILTNGAHVIINDKVIHKDPIDKDFVKKLVNDFEKLNIQYMLQGEIDSYMKEHYEEFYNFFDNANVSRKCLKGDYNIDNVETLKIEMLCQDEKSTNYCLSLGDDDYDFMHHEKLNSFEFYSKKNTKATGILKTLEHLNIPIENSYAFGDGKNDIEMLSSVGCGIAMGNASDEVKGYAKEITHTVHNNGIAHGIKNFILS